MNAGKEEGTLLTEPIIFDGKYMFVNADLKDKKSALAVEILDKDAATLSERLYEKGLQCAEKHRLDKSRRNLEKQSTSIVDRKQTRSG